MKELFNQIIEWQNETFKKATSISKLAHLKKELKELEDDLAFVRPQRRLEFADCFILLFGAASKDGMTYEEIVLAIEEKLKINKSRSWGEPDENGVVEHIK